MNKLIVVGVLGLFLISFVSAYSIDFFYSESCPHCQSVYPGVVELSKIFNIKFLDVNKGSYDIGGVPLIRIKTNDCRNLELVGSQDIPNYLQCELAEQTTKGCPTYSGEFNPETQSWFIR